MSVNTSRASEESGLIQAGLPKLLVDAYVGNKCAKGELFTIWGIYEKKNNLTKIQEMYCSTLIDTCDDETRIPKEFKDFSLKQLDQEIRKVGRVNHDLVPVVFAYNAPRPIPILLYPVEFVFNAS